MIINMPTIFTDTPSCRHLFRTATRINTMCTNVAYHFLSRNLLMLSRMWNCCQRLAKLMLPSGSVSWLPMLMNVRSCRISPLKYTHHMVSILLKFNVLFRLSKFLLISDFSNPCLFLTCQESVSFWIDVHINWRPKLTFKVLCSN